MLKDFFNQRAAIWDETVSEKDPEKLTAMARRLKLKPGAKVLDIGTGTGVFIPFLLDQIVPGGHIVALDFAEEMLKIAQDKGFPSSIEYLCADVISIPLADESFDAAVCYSSFPHFQDKPRALAEINRVLKYDGRLLICHTSSRDEINKIHHSIPAVRHDTIPDQREMESMLLAAGFTDIEIQDNHQSYLATATKRD